MTKKEVAQEIQYNLTVDSFELMVIKEALRRLYHSEDSYWIKAEELLSAFSQEDD